MAEIVEEPITIAEEPITNATTIDPEPATIDPQPVTTDPETIDSGAGQQSRHPEPITTDPTPKRKPGRPQGSKSKEPGKPRRKKVEIQEEKVEIVEPQELPRATPGSFPIPEEAFDLKTAKMLRLLQMQKDVRVQQKRNMYSSWFK